MTFWWKNKVDIYGLSRFITYEFRIKYIILTIIKILKTILCTERNSCTQWHFRKFQMLAAKDHFHV